MDVDGSKTIDKEETLKFWKTNFAKLNTDALFKAVDVDNSGDITEDEWLQFWEEVKRAGHTEQEIEEETPSTKKSITFSTPSPNSRLKRQQTDLESVDEFNEQLSKFAEYTKKSLSNFHKKDIRRFISLDIGISKIKSFWNSTEKRLFFEFCFKKIKEFAKKRKISGNETINCEAILICWKLEKLFKENERKKKRDFFAKIKKKILPFLNKSALGFKFFEKNLFQKNIFSAFTKLKSYKKENQKIFICYCLKKKMLLQKQLFFNNLKKIAQEKKGVENYVKNSGFLIKSALFNIFLQRKKKAFDKLKQNKIKSGRKSEKVTICEFLQIFEKKKIIFAKEIFYKLTKKPKINEFSIISNKIKNIFVKKAFQILKLKKKDFLTNSNKIKRVLNGILNMNKKIAWEKLTFLKKCVENYEKNALKGKLALGAIKLNRIFLGKRIKLVFNGFLKIFEKKVKRESIKKEAALKICLIKRNYAVKKAEIYFRELKKNYEQTGKISKSFENEENGENLDEVLENGEIDNRELDNNSERNKERLKRSGKTNEEKDISGIDDEEKTQVIIKDIENYMHESWFSSPEHNLEMLNSQSSQSNKEKLKRGALTSKSRKTNPEILENSLIRENLNENSSKSRKSEPEIIQNSFNEENINGNKEKKTKTQKSSVSKVKQFLSRETETSPQKNRIYLLCNRINGLTNKKKQIAFAGLLKNLSDVPSNAASALFDRCLKPFIKSPPKDYSSAAKNFYLITNDIKNKKLKFSFEKLKSKMKINYIKTQKKNLGFKGNVLQNFLTPYKYVNSKQNYIGDTKSLNNSKSVEKYETYRVKSKKNKNVSEILYYLKTEGVKDKSLEKDSSRIVSDRRDYDNIKNRVWEFRFDDEIEKLRKLIKTQKQHLEKINLNETQIRSSGNYYLKY